MPTGIWIDEKGRIVRAPEVAYSKRWTFGTLVAGDDRYAEGLRDWVAKGEASSFVMSSEALTKKLAPRKPERSRADVHFKLAVHLHRRGKAEAARRHWEESQRLAPDNWNYHRQDWAFRPAEERRASWRRKFEELEGAPYYEPADLP